MKKHNPVGWFEIYVQDLNRAKTFYESVFEFKLQEMEGPGVEIWGFPMERDQMGISGALVKMQGVSPGGNSTIVYFMCDDCSDQAKRVEKFGGRIQKEKFSIGQYGFISLVYDTEGNVFGLHSMK